MAKEKNLTTVTSVAAADLARVVTSAGASVKATFANVAKYIVETYNGSTVAGSAQSVKSALDSLNSKLSVSYVPSLPVTSAVTSSNLRYVKYGRVISMSGWLKCDTNPSEGAVLFTLPKSTLEVQVIAYDQNAPNTVPAFTFRPTSGHMEFYKGNIAGHIINFGFTYITTED